MATSRNKKDDAQNAEAQAQKEEQEVAAKLEEKSDKDGDVSGRVQANQRQADAEKETGNDLPSTEDDKSDEDLAEEVKEENREAAIAGQTEETTLAEDALELKEDAEDRSAKPFDAGKLIGQRAVFDTSGNAGVADQDMRRAYPAYDLDALHREDVPEHLAKYIVSDEGVPAILERAEKAREDAPSTKKSKKS